MPKLDTYYAYHPLKAEIGERTVPYFTRRALGPWRDRLMPARLLAEWASVEPGAEVLHVHCGDGLAGAAIAGQIATGRLVLLDSHVAAVETARRTLEANGVTNAQVMLSDCAQAVRDRSFDSVLALMPKGRAVWEQTVRDAAHILRQGGDLYLAGAKNAGIKTAAKFMERVFGAVSVLAYKGGCRVLRAVKGSESAPEAGSYYAWSTVNTRVGDEDIAYTAKQGIFSSDKVDDGTRLLVETLQDQPLQASDQVLDVGCGSGVLTLVAARQAHAGHVIGLDADCRAVEATRRTLAHNSIPNAEAMLSDCGQAVSDRQFTAVVTNPPFHQERATTYVIAEQIIREAAALLQRRGRLYLVANSFLKYGPIVEEAFGSAEVLRKTNRFKVWYATKTR